ncbi:myb/SANT-like DNA-binding domain-containing protein 7 [Eublepharis macularius]|uniref:Myb/SANT-like DNA-binding domain-containing protein 7 n=1 Tax=Eublepharis macularius TaxID=481883 RepID=A0AA97JJA5_EUBMA|nr:myb/SANT-like DNA-binding domain-containing protein 7 [Eublepharis macularius]
MSSHAKSIGVRGSSWREKEILDLLSCWGEEKIQEALKSSHRNFDCFMRVAEQMALRGHKRSALECRSKTKTMRLEYKKVITHNGRSGNAPITCPYFRELDSILRGDASVRPKRLSRSMVLQVVVENGGNALELQEGSEELFSHEMRTTEGGLLRTSTPCYDVLNLDHPEMTAPLSDPDVTIDGLDGSGGNQSLAGSESDRADKENAVPDPGEGPNLRPDAELSPGTRLANIRSHRRRTAGLYSVAESMMAQSSQEHKAELEERRKEQQEARLWHK